jgi:S-DNA-T family DNA segregation ATPase FtsK/SpoIIIE
VYVRTVAVIIGAIFLIYGAFSTLMHDTTLVGEAGRQIGLWNLKLFGYLAYIDFLILFYPLYLFYRNPGVMRRREGYVGWMLFFISLVILQPLLVGREASGLIGRELYDAMTPVIGLAGLWLFWLMVFALSLTLVVDGEWEIGDRLGRWMERRREKRRERRERRAEKKAMRAGSVTVKAPRKPIELPRISFGWIRALFRNPFDHKREQEMERILTMELPPIEEEVRVKNTPRSKPRGLPPVEREAPGELGGELEGYKTELEENLEEEEALVDVLEKASTPPAHKAVSPTASPVTEEKATAKAKKTATSARGEKSSAARGVTIVDQLEENAKLLEGIEKGRVSKPKNFRLPKLDFLAKPPRSSKRVNEAEIDRKIGELLDKLGRFKIEGDVIRTYSGPLVTTFEFKPAPNVKVSKILGLQDDLAMALSAETIRIQAPIPGRDVVGIEIPNETFETIYLREILESDLFKNSKSPLTVALGKDIVGNPFVTDLKKLPHLLIAGTTGSGKSVGINAMLLSLLYRNDPDHLKLVLIDPKMLEFSIYNDIPHLLTPVIIEPKKAISALANMVHEMERRYKVMAESRVKNIDNYNEKARQEGWEEMPFIVVVIDELADLMMNGGKDVEYSIARLAQMARAAGIHLIVATQRPSVDVVTGLIKANLPSRLSYRVGQRIDSKVILDQMGAESLLGRGDALFTPPGAVGLVRLHAPWNSEEEIEKVVEFLKAQREPEYDESYLSEGDSAGTEGEGETDEELDPLYEQAREIVLTDKKTSISYLQRKLQIGYNRSANLIEQLERTGVLSAPNAKGQRELLL